MQIAALFTLLPFLAAASPLRERDANDGPSDSPGAVMLAAIAPGTPFQYQAISADGGSFYIGKPTNATPCPNGQCNLPTDVTAILVDKDGQARMASQMSTQSIFVASDSGALRYEAAHSNTAGSSDVLTGFEYLTPEAGHAYGRFDFHSNNPAKTGFWACPLADDRSAYQIMVSNEIDCVSIEIGTLTFGGEVAAWTY